MTLATAVLDLSGTRPLDTFTLNMVFPGSSKPTGWTIELAGPAHPQTIAAGEDFAQEAIDKAHAIELAQVNGRKWKGEQESVDDRRRRNVTTVCRRIIGWSPNPVFGFVSPEPQVFSLQNAVALFLHPGMGSFFAQITDYLASERAFTQPSGTT